MVLIVIYGEPKIKNNELVLEYTDINTPDGYVNFVSIWLMNFKFGNDFMQEYRLKFVKLKDQMRKLGLSITKIQKK